jgi:predicted GIY-YIG superfamily endonuclease
MKNNKEFLYVGHYFDINGKYILKIGTTNDLKRRAQEHTRNYRKAEKHTMPNTQTFVYDWFLPLSKYNTLRFEDKNRQEWQNQGIGEFVRNDRFVCSEKPAAVAVTIRKTYIIEL